MAYGQTLRSHKKKFYVDWKEHKKKFTHKTQIIPSKCVKTTIATIIIHKGWLKSAVCRCRIFTCTYSQLVVRQQCMYWKPTHFHWLSTDGFSPLQLWLLRYSFLFHLASKYFFRICFIYKLTKVIDLIVYFS